MRETFAVGRVDRKTSEVVWLRARRVADFPGPWKVRAVVGPSAGSATRDEEKTAVLPFPGVQSG